MSRRILIPLAGLAVFVAAAWAQESKDPQSRYAVDLRVRRSGEEEFGKDTRKYGVEVYTDGHSGDGIRISETGALSVLPARLFKTGGPKPADPLWQHGLWLTVRPAGQKEFAKGKRFGLEVFRDEGNGDLVYINEAGGLGAVPSTYAQVTAREKGKPKNPTWLYAMDLRVRKAGEKDFNKDTRKYGVEVFRDENNGNLVYITETGAFAVTPAKLNARDDKAKEPAWQHGLELAARKHGEKAFTPDTKRYGIEVFTDENTGNQLYLVETGAIAVVPGKFARTTPEGRTKPPECKHAMDLTVRKQGERDWAKSNKYGIEVYSDENNGNVIYLSETGDLSVVAPRSSE